MLKRKYMTTNLLITVIVLTYNSSSTVLETLNSIKDQTYKCIELIITDDGSSDTTIEICRRWLETNGKTFSNYNLITVHSNTGLPANCNRALYVSKGEWIKFIAADDTLKNECIEVNLKYISENNEVELLQTNADMYEDFFVKENFKSTLPNNFKEFFNLRDGRKQFDFLKNVGYPLCTPSVFIKKSIIVEVGGFDERFRFMEDMPLWFNLTKLGIKFYYHPISTVNYRSHNKSIASDGKKYMNAKFAKGACFFLKTYFPKDERSNRIKRIMRQLKFTAMLDDYGFNNNSILSKFLYLISTKI